MLIQLITGFRQYTPEGRPEYDELLKLGVGFEMDDKGRDWYDLRETFQEDTVKVVFYEDGTILQCETNVMELCPHGAAGVAELTEVPEGCTRLAHDKYMFDGEKVVLDVRYFEYHREYRLKVANEKVNMYRDLLDMGADVGAQLEAWREYRLAVFNIDPTLMDDIVWPEKPED